MPKLLLVSLFLLLSHFTFAQATIGVVAGGNLSRTPVDRDVKGWLSELKDGYRKKGWTAGVFIHWPMFDRLSAEIDLRLVRRGFSIHSPYYLGSTVGEENLYVEIPLQVRWTLKPAFVKLGLNPTYWLYRKMSPVRGQNFNVSGFKYGPYRRLNLGIIAGVGYNVPFAKGMAISLEFHQFIRKDVDVWNRVFPLGRASYFSLNVRTGLLQVKKAPVDSMDFFVKVQAGADIHLGYVAELDGNPYEQIVPFSPKFGILVGRRFEKWELETGLLYTQRRKLFGGKIHVSEAWDPIQIVVHGGSQLRKDLLEVPLKFNYFISSQYYATIGLSTQFELSQSVRRYNRQPLEDDKVEEHERQQLLAASAGMGYRLPEMFGYSTALELNIQQGLNPIKSQLQPGLGYVPLVANLSLAVEL